MKLLHNTALLALASSFALTSAASAQHTTPARLRLTIELDPALAMGPRVNTIVPIRLPGTGRRFLTAQSLGTATGITYWNRPYIFWSDGSYTGPTLLGTPARIDDAPREVAATVRKTTPAEALEALLRDGQYQQALDLLEVMNTPEGTDAKHIIALEGAGRTGEAARLLVERVIHTRTPETLGIDREAAVGAREVRRLQGLAAQYAADAGDPNGYVLLASHLASKGHSEQANRMIQRAIQAGLDAEAAQLLKSLGMTESPDP